MNYISTQKYILMSPRKIRQVVAMVKKLSPSEAVEVLPIVEKRAAMPLVKVIKSAVANAKQKGIDVSELIFKEIQIGEGPALKRWRAGARGRAKPYTRRMSHIRVVLSTKEKEKPSLKETKTKAFENKSKIKDKKAKLQSNNVKRKVDKK